jgi:prepilin-type N-terminal cleavage/methylation domain-containing protein
LKGGVKNMKKFINKGFTLIELLIVIAILGILATVIVISINPLQNMAKTRDSGRLSAVAQLGHSLEAVSTANNGNFIAESNTWITTLVTLGEINAVPAAITYSISGISACSNSNPQNGICYNASSAAGAAPAIVYSRLEGAATIGRCAAGQWAYAVYSTEDGRAGIVCRNSGAANEPVPGGQTFLP